MAQEIDQQLMQLRRYLAGQRDRAHALGLTDESRVYESVLGKVNKILTMHAESTRKLADRIKREVMQTIEREGSVG